MDNPHPAHATRIESEGISGRLRRHSTELVRLAAPIVVSRSGFLLMVMADTVMTGRFDAAELAYLAIGLGLIMPMLVTSLGLIMGTLVLTANSFGAGRLKGCGPVWRRSLNYAFVLGVVCIGIGYFGYEVLLLTGQTRDVAMHGGEIMWIVSLGLPGHLLFLSSAFFLEGIGRPSHGMVIMILANVLNVVLNWLLIDGPWLSEPMGAAGAAWGNDGDTLVHGHRTGARRLEFAGQGRFCNSRATRWRIPVMAGIAPHRLRHRSECRCRKRGICGFECVRRLAR